MLRRKAQEEDLLLGERALRIQRVGAELSDQPVCLLMPAQIGECDRFVSRWAVLARGAEATRADELTAKVGSSDRAP